MTAFLVLAALLVAGALLFVVPPMLGVGARARQRIARQRQAETALLVLREQLADLEAEQAAGRIDAAAYRRNRDELEARALEEGLVVEEGADGRPASAGAVMVALAVPVLAVAFYLSLGEPEGLDPAKVAGAPEHSLTPAQIVEMAAKLVDRLETETGDPTAWLMLARTYAMLNDLPGAASAWARIGKNVPDHPDVLVDWADLLVAGREGDFSGEPDRLIARALELDGNNAKALALAGSGAFERGDFASAAAQWEKVLQQVPASEPVHASILQSINEARSRSGMLPLTEAGGDAVNAPQPSVATAGEGGEGGDGLSVSGTVRFSPEHAASVSPDETVFVFVRQPGGGPPVAALRYKAGDLPVSFDFKGVDRMSNGPLSDQIIVAARLSRRGDPMPQPGDLEGSSGPTAPDAVGVEVVIDRVRE